MPQSISNEAIIELMQGDMAMALGCTEPVAAALAVVKARETLGEIPEKIQLLVSGNIYKNGSGVGIPGTKMRGIAIAAALGVFTGKSEDALEVLGGINEKILEKAQAYVNEGRVGISVKNHVDKLYIEARLFGKEKSSAAVVEKKHTNISSAWLNGKKVFTAPKKQCGFKQEKSGKIKGLSIERLFDFARNVEFEKIKFVLDGANPNWLISEEGLKNNYCLRLGKVLKTRAANDKDDMRMAMARVAAGVDARMSGSTLPVMTNSGSGNQGITIYVPIINHALSENCTNERLARALAFGNAVPIHIKRQIGPLSALCGIIPASIGAACGIAFLRGADIKQIHNIVQFVLANISGMFCDGAKASCSLKAASGISAAYQAIYLAMDNACDAFDDGIINSCVECSIDNLSKIAVSAMDATDEEILKIMLAKGKC